VPNVEQTEPEFNAEVVNVCSFGCLHVITILPLLYLVQEAQNMIPFIMYIQSRLFFSIVQNE